MAASSIRSRSACRATLAGLASALLVVGGALSAMADGVPTNGGGSSGPSGPIGTQTVIRCDPHQVYDGTPLTPCSATTTVLGSGAALAYPTVAYEGDHTSAGTVHVNASYSDPTGQYASSTGLSTFTIDPAKAGTTVTCPKSAAYTGQAVEPCTAAVVTDSGTTLSDVDVFYTNNVGPGTATASANTEHVVIPNYTIVGGTYATFQIGAPTTIAITCAAGQVYTGAPIEPCTAVARTADGTFSTTVSVTYESNTNAGTAIATASYAGDGGHLGSVGSTSFQIGKAPASVLLRCQSAQYTGAEVTPCAVGLQTSMPVLADLVVHYTDNINVGTGKVSVGYTGDANHETAVTKEATFAITPAPVTVTVSCPTTVDFTGAAVKPCTAAVTGAGGLNATAQVTYTNNVYAGTASAAASYPGDPNHLPGSGSATFQVKGFSFGGYYSPVAMSSGKTPVWNTVKAGSTVPLKFEAFLPDGTQITDTTTLGSVFTTTRTACPATVAGLTVDQASTLTTGLRYDTTAGQFVQNWKTPKTTGCYQVTTTTADHSILSAFFILR